MDAPVRYYALALLGASFGVAAQPAVDPMDPAPEGYQWVELASVAMGSAVADYNAIVAPDLVAGDFLLMPLVVLPGGVEPYDLTLFTDGHFEYADGLDTSRQTADGWAWDTSEGDWHAESFDYIANNIAPIGDEPLERVLLVGSAMTPITLSEYFSDGEGDTLTYSLTSGTEPTGVSLAAGVISGTPSVEDEDGVTLVYTADDGYGGTGTQEIFLRPLATLPASDCTTDETSQSDCELAFFSDFGGTISFNITPTYSETIALDAVISQSPLAGAEMAPFSTVELFVSLGTCGDVGGATFADGTFADGTFADGTFGGCVGSGDVEVPNVIGEASFAAADAILEGDDLDGSESSRCSAETVGEVIAQSPSAGLLVASGTVVSVTTSSGMECSGGRPRRRLGLGLESAR
jgi:hypothetical protein